MPNTYTGVFRFDATSHQDARDFGRGIRRASKNHIPGTWELRNARLLRIRVPDGYVDGNLGRFEAVVKVEADELNDARSFFRMVRTRARIVGVPAPRRLRDSSAAWPQWDERNAKLLRIVEPASAKVTSDDAVPDEIHADQNA